MTLAAGPWRSRPRDRLVRSSPLDWLAGRVETRRTPDRRERYPARPADNPDGIAADLAARGWTAWNIEYRRLGLGGYPSTLQDAAAAIDHLATLADAGTEPVVAIGHGAGGHLATWAAGRAKPEPSPGNEPLSQSIPIWVLHRTAARSCSLPTSDCRDVRPSG